MASAKEAPRKAEAMGEMKYMVVREEPRTNSPAVMGSQFTMSVEAALEDWLNSNMKLYIMDRKVMKEGRKIVTWV
jgi:hypothetical protein